MNRSRGISLSLLALLLLLGGCATRPINPPIKDAGATIGYTFQTRQKHFRSQENLVVLAFSGGGTRAAAFSYGVLEFLRRTEAVGPKGNKVRLLDAVDMITGVSGGSFTALAYGLYGDKLFADYEQRFLKRDVQGELIARAMNPLNWGKLSSTGWGRSELAADFYDEILFNGATFGDLDRGDGPFIVASATDISSGGRMPFNQNVFNVLCSDLNAVRLSRAAAASSAVPVVSPRSRSTTMAAPVTSTVRVGQAVYPNRGSAAARRACDTRVQDLPPYTDGVHRPYIHLVDGGVSDNLGMRGVLDALEFLEALHDKGIPTPLDQARRIIVFVVNSLSDPPTNWDESENPPGTFDILLKATGAPIDHYSFEAIEQLKDIAARWRTARELRNAGRVFDQQGLADLRRDTSAGGGGLRHRCVVCHAPRQGGTSLSESAAHVVRPAGRGRRSPARRSGNDHPRVARVSAAAEGRGCESRYRSVSRRGAAGSALNPSAAR